MVPLLLAAAVQAAGTASLPTTVLARPEVLERCRATTVEAAAACIQSALSREAGESLALTAGQPWRAALDARLRAAFRLDDPAAPVPSDMSRHGVYSAAIAPTILIAAVDARRERRPVDYPYLARLTAVAAAATFSKEAPADAH